jgi:membrane-associated phospholipid phosphatase
MSLDMVAGFIAGVLAATLFWGYRHNRLEERLQTLLRRWADEEDEG